MRRKVSKIGPATLMVSLPSRWVKDNHIKKGDELDIIQGNGELIIRMDVVKDIKETAINLTENNEFSRRLLYIPYIKGYDSIKVHFNSLDQLNLIRKCADNMFGFEITEQTEKYCILKNIAEGLESELDNVFKRMLFLTMTLGTDFYEILKTNQTDRLKMLIETDKLANKINRFCKRMINKNPQKENSIIKYRVGCLLEQIIDNYCNILRVLISKNKIKFDDKSLELLKSINVLIKNFNNLYFNFNADEFLAFKKNEAYALGLYKSLAESSNRQDTMIMGNLMCILHNLHHIVEDIY